MRFSSTPPPGEPGSGETPMMAIDRGRKRRPRSGRPARCARSLPLIATPAVDAPASRVAAIGAETGLERLFIEKLLEPPIASLFRIEVARLMALGHQIIVGKLPGHALN